MIVISVQAAGAQEARKQGAYTSIAPPLLVSVGRPFNSPRVLIALPLQESSFASSPTSNSLPLSLLASLAEARSRISLAMRPPLQKRADFPAGLSY